MLGKVAGAVLGSRVATAKTDNPIAGAVIGMATVALARRFLPARVAMLGATIAGAYLTKKWAEREARYEETKAARAASGAAGIADPYASSTMETPVIGETPVTGPTPDPVPAPRKRKPRRDPVGNDALDVRP